VQQLANRNCVEQRATHFKNALNRMDARGIESINPLKISKTCRNVFQHCFSPSMMTTADPAILPIVLFTKPAKVLNLHSVHLPSILAGLS
jgi:hypothetical protein